MVAAGTGGDIAGVPARAPTWRTWLPKAARWSGRAALTDLLALERDRGGGFLLLPVLLCAGAVGYFSLPSEPDALLLGGVLLAASVGCFAFRRHALFGPISVAVLLLLLGMTAGKIETSSAGTKMLGGEISTAITGRVVVVEVLADGRTRLTIDILETRRPTLRYAPDRVRVSARNAPAFRAGDGVEGVARLLPPSGPARPGAYDFAFESYMDGIGAVGFFLTPPRAVQLTVPATLPDRLRIEVAAMRDAIATRIRQRIGGAEGEIAAALVAGVRAGIPEEVNETLRVTGLAHVLSISGLHMALVAGTVMLAMRASFALAPGFASRRPVRKYAAAIALVATSYYLLVSGAAVAAQRSYIMIAVMLVAMLFDRAAITMRNFAISAIIVIAFSPHEAVGPSFQMSFAATAALIAAYSWWSQRKLERPMGGHHHNVSPVRRGLRTALGYALGLAATSIVAGLATTLFSVWHFHRIAPLGLLANLGAMPVVSAVIMPAAVATGVLMPFGLEGPALDVMGYGISIMLAVTRFVAELSPVDVVGTIPGSSVVLLALALTVATLTTTGLRWFALPLAIAGMASILMHKPADVMISEDARLVALLGPDGALAVNRARPNGFTIGVWKDAAATGDVRVPAKPTGSQPDDTNAQPPADGSFLCSENGCIASHASGARVAHVPNAAAAERLCQHAAVIVIDDATAGNPCGTNKTLVITKRDLARRGSAELRFSAASPAQLDFALEQDLRPWHDHRRFSRAARGLAPYRRANQASDGPGRSRAETPSVE